VEKVAAAPREDFLHAVPVHVGRDGLAQDHEVLDGAGIVREHRHAVIALRAGGRSKLPASDDERRLERNGGLHSQREHPEGQQRRVELRLAVAIRVGQDR